jgi:hypothetical protein
MSKYANIAWGYEDKIKKRVNGIARRKRHVLGTRKTSNTEPKRVKSKTKGTKGYKIWKEFRMLKQ